MDFLIQPAGDPRLGDVLVANLGSERWSSFDAGIAFVKRSGVRHLQDSLLSFAARGRVRIAFGVDHQGSSVEGASALLESVSPTGEVWVFHNEGWSTFHPKLYLFSNDSEALVVIGSGNLTEGGLFTNYEASVAIDEQRLPGQSPMFDHALAAIDSWCDPSTGLSMRLDETSITRLASAGYLVPEVFAREEPDEPASREGAEEAGGRRERLFGRVSVPGAPATRRERRRAPADEEERRGSARRGDIGREGEGPPIPAGFVMTLQRTDVGVGQTSAGTSRRSPEIFIPLRARDAYPEFWGWDDEFVEDAAKPGKFDRHGVPMRLAGQVIQVNMMTWPDKHDFRLRNEELRSAGQVDDILRIERSDPASGYDYFVEIIPQGTTLYPYYERFCANRAAGASRKMWGYY